MEAGSSGRPIAEIVESLWLNAHGTVDTELVSAFLPSLSGDGPMQVDVQIEGPLDNLDGHGKVDGREASLILLEPYYSRLEELELELELGQGEILIHSAVARLNDGHVEAGGWVGFDGRADLGFSLDGVNYVLDHGLTTVLSGDLRVVFRDWLRGELSGRVVAQRGLVRRDLDVDRELLAALLEVPGLEGTEESLLENLALDLTISTWDGVRVRNNVADLQASWDPIRVRGTAAQPVVEGVIEVDPGGLVYAYGQTLRLDRASLVYPGIPGVDATLKLETTSSLEDPSVARQGSSSLLDRPRRTERGTGELRAALTKGVAAHYGERLANQLTQEHLQTRVSFSTEPVIMFGEAAPDGRITATRDFSSQVALAVSADLRTAEGQTYVLHIHDLTPAPSLVLQLFTNDSQDGGATVAQRLRFGGGGNPDESLPRLGKISVLAPPGFSSRWIRRSLGLPRGAAIPPGIGFEKEVEISEQLRHRGYPGASVSISVEESQRSERLDLVVKVDPGPPVEYFFEGDQPPRAHRGVITGLYRPYLAEEASLLEMERKTVQVFRGMGYLYPEIRVIRMASSDDGRIVVQITSHAGERVGLLPPLILGLETSDAIRVSQTFQTELQRAELAVGEPTADARLIKSLESLGYPDAEISGRTISREDGILTVDVEPGERQRISSVQLDGADPELGGALGALSVQPGDPVRWSLLSQEALRIEAAMEKRGYYEARVQARLDPVSPEQPHRLDLTFLVNQGPKYQLDRLEVESTGNTRPGWAEQVADIDTGNPLRREDVAAARRRLYETGLFTSIRGETHLDPEGESTVSFHLEERPRFSVGYGLRWDNDVGTQGVLELIDGNFMGRGVTLGVRSLYRTNDKSFRALVQTPFLFGRRTSLEIFGEAGTRIEDGLIDDRVEASLQLSFPLAPRVTGRIYGRYRNERFYEEEPDDFFPIDVRIVSPYMGLQLIYDTRDQPFLTGQGLFASADLSGSGDFLASDFRYLRFFGQVNLFRPAFRLLSRQVTWGQSVRVGYANSLGQELIRSERFFAGGEYSVRGYPFESLGPQERLGSVIRPLGGELLLVLNEEARFPIWRDLSGLLFLDAGNVWATPSDFDSELFFSAGLGFRAVTPLGLLRLDLAFPINGRPTDPEYKIYAGFGTVF